MSYIDPLTGRIIPVGDPRMLRTADARREAAYAAQAAFDAVKLPVSGVHDSDCKWLCRVNEDAGEMVCTRKHHCWCES